QLKQPRPFSKIEMARRNQAGHCRQRVSKRSPPIPEQCPKLLDHFRLMVVGLGVGAAVRDCLRGSLA
ncbi:hypothetical protein ACGYTS_21915, partial [Burkholderia pseudomallei]